MMFLRHVVLLQVTTVFPTRPSTTALADERTTIAPTKSRKPALFDASRREGGCGIDPADSELGHPIPMEFVPQVAFTATCGRPMAGRPVKPPGKN